LPIPCAIALAQGLPRWICWGSRSRAVEACALLTHLREFRAGQRRSAKESSPRPAPFVSTLSLTRFRGQVRGSDTGYLVGLVFKIHRGLDADGVYLSVLNLANADGQSGVASTRVFAIHKASLYNGALVATNGSSSLLNWIWAALAPSSPWSTLTLRHAGTTLGSWPNKGGNRPTIRSRRLSWSGTNASPTG
jgi:hypothetical protein